MQRYILIRLVQAVFALLAVSIIVFGLARAAGNPLDVILPVEAGPEVKERMTKQWGLDRPLYEQYWRFLKNAVQGDFGDSLTKWPNRGAMDLIGERWANSLQLMLTGLFLAATAAVILGVVTATMKDTPVDYIGKLFALFGQSAPSFWIGLMLIWIFAVLLGWFPTSGKGGISHMVLPVITLGAAEVASVMRLMRSAMLDTLDSEYVKLARIKAVPEWKVIWKHCLRNAAIIPITYFGIIAGGLVTGTAIVETVFAWPGMGQLIVEASLARDFQVVQAVAVVVAVGFISINLLVDILYGYMDPRIRAGFAR